jgi:starch phosphorylase
MKVLVNGGLNLSTLDGWWAEAFDPASGWAVGDRHEQDSDDRDDALDLYARLEEDVVPAFYDRDAAGFPRQWIARMRASMATLTPQFSSARMVQEYVERAYVPGAASFGQRVSLDNGITRELAAWARHLGQHWAGIGFGALTTDLDAGTLTVSVPVDLGEIRPSAVRVELYAEARADHAMVVQPMSPVAPVAVAPNAFVYRVSIATARPPADFTVRVVPWHPDARVPLELALIAWQR